MVGYRDESELAQTNESVQEYVEVDFQMQIRHQNGQAHIKFKCLELRQHLPHCYSHSKTHHSSHQVTSQFTGLFAKKYPNSTEHNIQVCMTEVCGGFNTGDNAW